MFVIKIISKRGYPLEKALKPLMLFLFKKGRPRPPPPEVNILFSRTLPLVKK